MQEVVVATTNKGKMREFANMLADFPFKVTSLADHFDPVPDIAETGSTFEENARIKARWVASRLGLWVLADDSGLEVDALDGAPGVRSARYAGEGASDAGNLSKLLAALEGVADAQRTARFRCVIVLCGVGGELAAQGVCQGSIIRTPAGTGGFGYDPVFVPDGFHRTFGQLDPGVKNAISHRGKALLNLRKEIHSRHGITFH